MLDTLISEPFLGFSRKALNFFSKLKNKKCNNKKWFDANRDVFEFEIKLPMRSLLVSLTPEL